MAENFLTAYWIKILASVAVFVALIVMFIRQSRDQANADPLAVVNELNQLGPDYAVVSNVVVPAERGIYEVGHIVVSPYGVFVITVKHEIGKVFGREGDSEWEVKSGGKSDLLYNPLWENRKHVNALEKMIGSVPFIPIIVFTRARLKEVFGGNIIRLSALRQTLLQNKTSRLSPDKRDEILQILRKLSR